MAGRGMKSSDGWAARGSKDRLGFDPVVPAGITGEPLRLRPNRRTFSGQAWDLAVPRSRFEFPHSLSGCMVEVGPATSSGSQAVGCGTHPSRYGDRLSSPSPTFQFAAIQEFWYWYRRKARWLGGVAKCVDIVHGTQEPGTCEESKATGSHSTLL